jgi:Rieske 2Fe-2S family protein
MDIMARTQPLAIVGEVRTLPGLYYWDPAIYVQEQERIFSRLWVCAGRADQIGQPGDYLLHTTGNESVIVLRDSLSGLRAFLNICRHRGARLCTEEGGQLNATIQCRYHAWTYGLDGRLVGAPNTRHDPLFQAERFGLLPVAVEEWEGLIWLNLRDNPPPLATQLSGLYSRFAHYHVGQLALGAREVYEVRANWKLIVENFSECYHCATVHPELTAQVPEYRQGHVTGQEGGAAQLGPGIESLTTTGKTSRSPFRDLMPEDLHAYYGDVLKPNVFLNLHPDYVVVHVLSPLAPDRTRIICDWLFDPAVAAAPDFDPSDAVDFWDLVNRQDWEVCELAQQGMTSRGYTAGGFYAEDERHIRRFNDWVLEMLSEPAGRPR